MRIFRDSTAIHAAVTSIPEIAPWITKRIQELSEYEDCDLGELLNVVVIERLDTLAAVDSQLGRALEDTPPDVIETHPGWFELTYVVSDDGFGLVVYVPQSPDIDPRLTALCTPQASASQ